MTIYGRSEELVSRCVECDLAEPESLTSLGGSAPGVVDGILSRRTPTGMFDRIPSTTPGAEPPRDAKDSGSARSHSTHLETSSSYRP